MEIKIIEPKDAVIYRDIRLEALKATPEAFSSSYEEEKEYPLESFENRLNYYAKLVHKNKKWEIDFVVEK